MTGEELEETARSVVQYTPAGVRSMAAARWGFDADDLLHEAVEAILRTGYAGAGRYRLKDLARSGGLVYLPRGVTRPPVALLRPENWADFEDEGRVTVTADLRPPTGWRDCPCGKRFHQVPSDPARCCSDRCARKYRRRATA